MSQQEFRRRLKTKKIIGKGFYTLLLASTSVGIISLIVLLIDILIDSWGYLRWELILNYPSRFPEQAGMKSAIVGSIWIVMLTGLISFPLGVGAAIYLQEYAPQNWLTRIIQTNIANLAGVPSIVYGLLGLALFVYFFALGRSIIAGALTMSLLALPVIIIASQEAIAAVPQHYRQAAYALGATRWQVVWHVVLPIAFPSILTGVILAMSRVIGDAAPMIAIAALVYITFLPTSIFDRFTVMPIQIFNWISRPQEEFHSLAAAGIIILLIVLLAMNATAIILRGKLQKRLAE